MPGTFQSAADGTFVSAIDGTFQSDMSGTFGPLLSSYLCRLCSLVTESCVSLLPKSVHCCYQNLSTPDYRNLCTYRYRLHLAVLNYLCDFFSCKHLFLREDTSPGINSLYALHRSLTTVLGLIDLFFNISNFCQSRYSSTE